MLTGPSDAKRNRNAGEINTFTEGTIADTGDAVGNRNAGQVVATPERPISDAGNSPAYYVGRDDNRAAGAGIAGNGNVATVYRVVVILGQTYNRKRQK